MFIKPQRIPEPMEFRHHPARWLRHWISAPFIYTMIVPIVILDVFLEIYHRICFPLYGIAYVKRWQYIRMDRHQLSYLHWLEKINCAYCSYANGLAAYTVQIAGETEKYWCGIKHQEKPGVFPQLHQKDFLKYGDEEAFNKFCKLQSKKSRR